MADKPNDIETIYNTARQKLSGAERSAYLDNACGNDAALRARAEALLKADDQAGSFLDAPAFDVTVTFDKSPLIEGPGTVIGPYKLLEKIGEGGMAYVYMAEQERPLRRRVALKIIKLGMDTKQVIARFEVERQALAVMDHPNIAKVFDAGATETGRPYFVMELVKGVSITEYCDKNKLNTKERLDLFIQVCNAVQHAHQKGIIHRDIKPSNVMVTLHDGKPVPKVIDFGIAKATIQRLTEKTLFTKYAQMIGTPEYMSPEQAEMSGLDIDTRADIYSLGVLLYELLTGTTPFDAEDLRSKGYGEMQRIIRETEPLKPSTKLSTMGDALTGVAEHRKTNPDLLAKLVRGDLDWIVMKTLEKDRTRRYETVSSLAADVKRHLNEEPVEAGPPGATYRIGKFIRKHRRTVAAVGTIAAILVIGLLVSTTMYFIANQARQKETVARTRAEQARESEAVARNQAEQAEIVAQEQKNMAETKAEDLRRAMYVNNIQLADAKYKEGNIRHVRELLTACPNDLRGWEWNRLNHISDQSIMTISGRENIIHSISFSPDGKRIVSGGWGKNIKMWDAATGVEITTFTGHEDNVGSVAFSTDGKRLVSGSADKTVKIWDAASGTELMTLRGHDNEVWHIAFSPDGKHIASAERGEIIKIWDAVTGAAVTNIQHGGESVGGLAFSPDGKHIASGVYSRIYVWDANSGDEVTTIPAAHRSWVTCVAYSPDGKHIVSSGGWDPKIKVWDAATAKEVMTLHGRSQWVFCVNYDSTGRFILSSNINNTINIWDAVTGEELMTLRGHQGPCRSALFSGDGKRIISSSDDKTIKVWHVPTTVEQLTMKTTPWMFSVSFSPDSKRIASAGPQNQVTIWDTSIGAEAMSLYGHEDQVCDAIFSPDGRYIASASRYGAIKVWDTATGKQLMDLCEHKGDESFWAVLCYNPDGKHIAAGGEDGVIRIYNITTGLEVMALRGHEGQIYCVAYSPDGRRIVSGGNEQPIRVWDPDNGTEVMKLNGHRDKVFSVSFSPDGRSIASGGADKKVRVWHATTGSELMTLLGHDSAVSAVSFSPDGRRLLSASRFDGTIRIWDVTVGAELMTLSGEDVYRVAFSPDGNTIAALYWEGLILWETTKPSGGYGRRETAQEARELVKKLYEKHGYYYEVINKLQDEELLDEKIRKLALPIANSLRWWDVYKLNEESWKVVSLPDGNEVAYREALNKAERVVSLNPHRVFVNTLGVAQYRVGAYEDALLTLSRSDKMLTDANEPSAAQDLAFIAMALQKLNRVEEAKLALERLRELCKEEGFAEDEEAKPFLAEAEKLIQGEKQ